MLQPLPRSRSAQVAAATSFIITLMVGFLPTFAGPGYESALAAGVTLPSLVAIAAAVSIGRARPEPFDAFNRGVAMGAVVFVAASLAIAIHGVRVGFCEPWDGTLLVLLGPGIGCLLAGAWGAIAGEMAGRRKRPALAAVPLALMAPLASVVASFVRFYTSPMVFAYDPFAGYFSGTLYDTVVDSSGLITYRAGSAATLLAAFMLALHLGRNEQGRVNVQSIGRPGLALVGGLAAVVSFLHVTAGPRLGHWHTRSSIGEALGGVVTGERCVVIHPRSMSPEAVQRFARECEANVVEVETWLGAKGPQTITAYLFASEGQKQSFMGASGTQVAKPWRAEVYLDADGYPHRSLGHELAHVIAGSVARGPFRIAGTAGGWMPDPGLIEGLAVAASPKEDDLSMAEWARAMRELDLLPPLHRLFGLGFLGESSSRAYTASGAFVEWARKRSGPEAIRRWYGGEPLETALGASLPELEKAWHADLDALPIAEAARVQARARFDKPAIFARRCPRTVDACKDRASDAARGGDLAGAKAQLARARELDDDPAIAIDDALLDVRAGDAKAARDALAAIAQDEAKPKHIRIRASEELGDLALAEGDAAAAEVHYVSIEVDLFDEARLRTLQVKLRAARDPRFREAIVALLVGRGARQPERIWSAEMLGALDATIPDDGLAAYLLARANFDQGTFEDAAVKLDRALSRPIPVPRVRAEAARLRLFTACGLGQLEDGKRALEIYAGEPGVRAARVASLRRFAARCGIAVPELAAPVETPKTVPSAEPAPAASSASSAPSAPSASAIPTPPGASAPPTSTPPAVRPPPARPPDRFAPSTL